jgi:hypothetical protein
MRTEPGARPAYARLQRALTYSTARPFYAARLPKEHRMPRKRPNEPIGPTTIPGEPTDPRIPEDQMPDPEEHEESEEDVLARESEKAFDQAISRFPPG